METKTYRVKLLEDMLGTVPKDQEVYRTYIESKKPERLNDEDEYLTVEKTEEKGWTGFHGDERGLFIYDYMIKGQLKNAAMVLKDELGIKALRSKIDNLLFVFPRKIYLGKNKPDGVVERPLRAMTAQGPRVTLARSDSIAAGTEFDFEFLLLPHKELTWAVVRKLLEYGELVGYGQFRNGSYGRFSVIK